MYCGLQVYKALHHPLESRYIQGRRKLDNYRGGYVHIFVHNRPSSNRCYKKLIVHGTNI